MCYIKCESFLVCSWHLLQSTPKCGLFLQIRKAHFEGFKPEAHRGRCFLAGASSKAHFCWLTVKAGRQQVLAGAQPLSSSRSTRFAGHFFFLFCQNMPLQYCSTCHIPFLPIATFFVFCYHQIQSDPAQSY